MLALHSSQPTREAGCECAGSAGPPCELVADCADPVGEGRAAEVFLRLGPSNHGPGPSSWSRRTADPGSIAVAADLCGARGHAVRPHTADAVIEAWGPTSAACYEEAVAAFVDLFADVTDSPTGGLASFDVGPGRPDDLLVLLLEEVLLDADARGHVPTVTRVEVRGDHLVGTFTLVATEDVQVVGSVPKGVSYHDLQFGPDDAGWRCRATVDV